MSFANLMTQAASLLGNATSLATQAATTGEPLLQAGERLATDLIALLRTHGVADFERAASDIMGLIDTRQTALVTSTTPAVATPSE